MITTDAVVIGGGCVGLTAALGLADKGLSVTVIDAGPERVELTEPELRVSAISAASEQIFRNLAVWQQIDHSRSAPYQSMKVWDKHSFGKIEFDAELIGEHRLGHIIENNNIRNGLIATAKAHSKVTLKFATKVLTLHNSPEQVLLTLADGTPLVAKLCVAADGANSWVRKQLNTPIAFSDYDHHAMVATIKTQQPHGGCARQVFLPEGPLALLPLSDANTCSIVWSATPEYSKTLQNMTDEAFNRALTAATDSELGVLTLASQRPVFPLTMRYAQKWVEGKVVFMGDAAHTIHPLAGLGMNLGLLDAASLVELVEQEQINGPELAIALSQYQGWRKAQAQEYIAAMSGLKELFAGSNPLKKLIRGLGLMATDKSAVIKHKIVSQATGFTGKLPKLAQFEDQL